MIERITALTSRQRLLLLAAGVGSVLLGLALLGIMGGGDGEEDSVQSAAPRQVTTTAPEASGTTDTSAPSPPPARDPFQQVVAVPRVSAQGLQAAPSAPVQPTQQATSAPQGATPARTQPAGGGSATLELTSIAADASGVRRAQITVEGQSHTLVEGETFAYGYRLERIDGNCVEVSAQDARARMCLPSPAP